MSNLTVENVYTRQTAKELAQKHFWKLLGLTVTAVGIPYLLSMIGTSLLALTQNQPVIMIGSLVLMLATTLVSSGLLLGLYSAMLDLCRGNDTITVSRVFSRMGECLKAFGLSLWVSLKTMLWALPAYALMIVPVLFLTSAPKVTVDSAQGQALQVLFAILPVLVMVLIFALVIPAALRYMLSVYVLADKPETGVFDCVNQSKAMMKGRKWQAFKLIIPIILTVFVILMVIVVAVSALAATLGVGTNSLVISAIMMIVMFATTVYYIIRMYLCYVLFYLKRTKDQESAQAE